MRATAGVSAHVSHRPGVCAMHCPNTHAINRAICINHATCIHAAYPGKSEEAEPVKRARAVVRDNTAAAPPTPVSLWTVSSRWSSPACCLLDTADSSISACWMQPSEY